MIRMNRRIFLRTTAVATIALSGLSLKGALGAENAAEKTNRPIGCFNRAWTKRYCGARFALVQGQSWVSCSRGRRGRRATHGTCGVTAH